MKKRVGELFGKPIVEGDPNEVTRFEIHLSEIEDKITLSSRASNGELKAITTGGSSEGDDNNGGGGDPSTASLMGTTLYWCKETRQTYGNLYLVADLDKKTYALYIAVDQGDEPLKWELSSEYPPSTLPLVVTDSKVVTVLYGIESHGVRAVANGILKDSEGRIISLRQDDIDIITGFENGNNAQFGTFQRGVMGEVPQTVYMSYPAPYTNLTSNFSVVYKGETIPLIDVSQVPNVLSNNIIERLTDEEIKELDAQAREELLKQHEEAKKLKKAST